LILDEALRFLLQFDPVQIRYVGPLFKSLLDDASSFYTVRELVQSGNASASPAAADVE
jgi:COP9 signalosome complex subunit 3